MTTFGEVSYNDDVFGGDKKQVNNKDLFLRLSEGSNELRLVTAPFQYLVHKYKKEGDPGFGQKVSCSQIHGSCPVCDMGTDKAKPRWFYGVIDRKTGTYKILDVSFAVFDKIRKLARNTARWGDPTKYDIDIVVDKNGGPTGYYSVQPIAKEPLSAADQKLKDDADLDDLKRRCTPLTPENVQKRLDKINGVSTDGVPSKTATSKVVAKSAKVQTVNMTDDGEEEDFPSYDGAATA
jgi:hypothetical protein